MNTSLQASGGRHLAPATAPFKFRALIWQEINGEWLLLYVFEGSSLETIERDALEECTAEWEPGTTAMHYVVGEVAR